MKNSKIYSVLNLALISGMLASCGNNNLRYERKFGRVIETSAYTAKAGEPEVKKEENGETIKINDPLDPVAAKKLTYLSTNNSTISLFYNKYKKVYESELIVLDYLPLTADISGLKYSSNDETVATVTKEGVVTAVSEGTTDIVIKSADDTISTKVHVVVNNSQIPVSYASTRKSEIADAQNAAGFVHPESIFLEETYSSRRVNMDTGEVLSQTIFIETFWISKSNSYFRITSEDYEAKVSGGSLVPGKVDYIFYSTKDYYSYAISTKDYSRNYMVIDQSSKSGTKSTYDCMLDVLNNFFTSGKAIVENQYNAAYGTDLISNAKLWNNIVSCGRFMEDKGQLAIYADETNNYQVGPDQEEDFDIPAYTPFTVNDKTRALWENNLLTYKSIDEIWEWKLDDVTYQDQTTVRYNFKTSDVELVKPDLTKYTKVADIFSL